MIPGAKGAGRVRALEVALAAILCHGLAFSSGGCSSPPKPEIEIPPSEAELHAAIRADRRRVMEWVTTAPEPVSDDDPLGVDPELVELGRRLSAYQHALDAAETNEADR